MTDLRRLARDQECQVRLPGICTFNPEQTVLAHFRLAGMSGMGVKNHDLFGAYACAACHAVCDGQVGSDLSRDQRMLALAEGVFRTQAVLLKRGILTLGDSHD